jgi:hypothetical protein
LIGRVGSRFLCLLNGVLRDPLGLLHHGIPCLTHHPILDRRFRDRKASYSAENEGASRKEQRIFSPRAFEPSLCALSLCLRVVNHVSSPVGYIAHGVLNLIPGFCGGILYTIRHLLDTAIALALLLI